MTAIPHWDIVDARYSDAELVRASLAGDRTAFGQVYDRYADRLHDFCVGMLRDRDGAADCVQDTFCVAATRMPQLREPGKLRPWLYSIARNEALRMLAERRRETPFENPPDEMSDQPGPETLAARTELADLISEAAGGLSDRDRTVLELVYRHGLDGPELAEALDVSHTNANTMVVRLRDTIERSLGALLVARRVRSNPAACPGLAAILDGWDGHFNVLMRKRVSRHVESCPDCDEERHRLVSPAALLGAPALIPAPAGLRELTLNEVRLTPSATPIEDGAEKAIEPDDASDERRSSLLPFVLLVAALIGAIGVVSVWVYQQNPVIAPADLTGTMPATPTAPPTGGGVGPIPSGPPSATPTTPTTTLTDVPLPPAQTTVTTEPPGRPGPPPPARDDEPTAVLEPTTDVTPVDPPPPSSNPPRSAPPPPSTTQRPAGIAGFPQSQAPQSPKRTAVNAPNRSRAPAPSR